MKKTILSILILLLTLITSCNNNDSPYINVDYSSVVGKWSASTTDHDSNVSAVINMNADSTYNMRVEFTFPYKLGFTNYMGNYRISRGIIRLIYNHKTLYELRITEFTEEQAQFFLKIKDDKQNELDYLFIADRIK